MVCQDANVLAAFVDGTLPADQRDQVLLHLDECADCRRAVSAAARTLPTRPGEHARGTPSVRDGSASVPDPLGPTIPRGTTIGRYVVREPIGAGAMGDVYAAYDADLNRHVALKIVRQAGDKAQARVLREAQALARLSHPNVTAVYDVDTLGDRVVLVIELVAGSPLGDWLREKARTWRDVIAAFQQAGRGLAAAHAVGLIHRDFKPDNVLVSRDGTVRVSDFGLARIVGLEPEPAPGNRTAIADLTAHAMTRTGAVVGTPAYMSPEQVLGEAVDPRSDQFSFCVALYEALYGRHPFASASLEDLAESVLAGRIEAPPQGTRVPAWLRRIVVRGLSPRPEDRYPSMEALLRALARDPRSARRRWSAALAMTALLGAGVASYTHHRRAVAASCQRADRQLAGIWDPSRKQALHDAFRATGVPFAEDTWRSASHVIDLYAAKWVAMQTEACEATRVRGTQSEELEALRTDCLSQRRRGLAALTQRFETPDARMMTLAIDAAYALPSLSPCADSRALARVPPPAAALHPVADQVRATLAEVRALNFTGQYKKGLAVASAAAVAARALGYKPLLAESLHLLGQSQKQNRRDDDAERTLRDAALTAEAGGDDERKIRIWSSLVHLLGHKGKFAEACAMGEQARATLDRLGGNDSLRAALLGNLASAYVVEGRITEAITYEQQALALHEKTLDHVEIANTLGNLGSVMAEANRYDEALAMHRRALALTQDLKGPNHWDVVKARCDLAQTLRLLDKPEEALVELERAQAAGEASLGRDHPRLCYLFIQLGETHLTAGHAADAVAAYQRAVAVGEPALGNAHPEVLQARDGLARSLIADHKEADALAELQRTIHDAEGALGPEHHLLAGFWADLAEAQMHLHQPARAAESLARAIRIEEGRGEDVDMEELPLLRFGLAKALWDAGRDRSHARSLATAARERLSASERAEVDRWLTTHARP